MKNTDTKKIVAIVAALSLAFLQAAPASFATEGTNISQSVTTSVSTPTVPVPSDNQTTTATTAASTPNSAQTAPQSLADGPALSAATQPVYSHAALSPANTAVSVNNTIYVSSADTYFTSLINPPNISSGSGSYTYNYAISGGATSSVGRSNLYVSFRDLWRGTPPDSGTAVTVSVQAYDTVLNTYGYLSNPLTFVYQPTPLFTITNGATAQSTHTATLLYAPGDTNHPLSFIPAQMQFKVNDGTWSGWENYNITKSIALDSTRTNQIVYGQFKDQAGNIITVADTSTLNGGALPVPATTGGLSPLNPLTAFKESDGTPVVYTNSVNTELSTFVTPPSVSGGSGLYVYSYEMIPYLNTGLNPVPISGTFNPADPYVYHWLLPDQSGALTMYVNTYSPGYNDRYLISKTPAIPPAPYSYSRLTFSGAFGGSSPTDGSYCKIRARAYDTVLKTYSDWTNAVWVKYVSAPPAAASVTIIGKSPANIATLSVTANSNTVSQPAMMQFKVNNGAWSAWEPFQATKTIALDTPQTNQTISCQLKDASGNMEMVSVSRPLSDIPSTPVAVTAPILSNQGKAALYNGVVYVNSANSTSDKLSNMFAAPVISGGSGSFVYEYTIDYDVPVTYGESFTTNTREGGSIGRQSPTRPQNPPVTGLPVPGVLGSSGQVVGDGTPIYGNPSNPWAMSGIITLHVTDTVLHTSSIFPTGVKVIKDDIPPSGSLVITNKTTAQNNRIATLNIFANNNTAGGPSVANTPMMTRYKLNNGAWSAWEPFQTTKSIALDNTTMAQTVYCEVMDLAGNSVVLSQTIPKAAARTMPTEISSLSSSSLKDTLKNIFK